MLGWLYYAGQLLCSFCAQLLVDDDDGCDLTPDD